MMVYRATAVCDDCHETTLPTTWADSAVARKELATLDWTSERVDGVGTWDYCPLCSLGRGQP